MLATMSFSTQFGIEKSNLASNGIISPPLSHASDMTCSEWLKVCAKYNTNIKTLKHMFIISIFTESTRQLFRQVLYELGLKM
jgi:hypothetical protein